MKKLTDFQIAAMSAVPGIIGGFGASAVDIWWAAKDYAVTGHAYLETVAFGLLSTLIFFVISAILLVWSLKRHRDTGEKPVQSADDIQYQVKLYLQKESFRRHCEKEQRLIRTINKANRRKP